MKIGYVIPAAHSQLNYSKIKGDVYTVRSRDVYTIPERHQSPLLRSQDGTKLATEDFPFVRPALNAAAGDEI
jgi:hypothetical protein